MNRSTRPRQRFKFEMRSRLK